MAEQLANISGGNLQFKLRNKYSSSYTVEANKYTDVTVNFNDVMGANESIISMTVTSTRSTNLLTASCYIIDRTTVSARIRNISSSNITISDGLSVRIVTVNTGVQNMT